MRRYGARARHWSLSATGKFNLAGSSGIAERLSECIGGLYDVSCGVCEFAYPSYVFGDLALPVDRDPRLRKFQYVQFRGSRPGGVDGVAARSRVRSDYRLRSGRRVAGTTLVMS